MTPIPIAYKDETVLRHCSVRWHPILIDVLLWIGRFTDEPIILTEGWRNAPKWKPSDIHCTDPLRAFDLRSWAFHSPERIEAEINRHWTYDPDRPRLNVALLHDSGNGLHFHIQVHDSTHLIL